MPRRSGHHHHPPPVVLPPLSSHLPPQVPTGADPGFIRILPREATHQHVLQKRCETCGKLHDGSFGAGRFCSSRCARTVGGLAHRRKRQLERSGRVAHSSSASCSAGSPPSSSHKMASNSSSGKAKATQGSRRASTLDKNKLKKSGTTLKDSHKRVPISDLLNPS